MTIRLQPDISGIAEAARILGAGGLVAFPTETVYGLGADATDAHAAARIYEAKGRPSFNPLIAHVADLEAAQREGMFDPSALILARAFWPGPLTLVVPVAPGGTVSELSRAGLASVGLRVPSHPIAQALLRAFGRPVAAPSANRSGHVSPTSAAHVLADLDGRLEAIIDGGDCDVGVESTIVACMDGVATLLRPGAVTREQLAAALGRDVATAAHDDEHAPQSPGRMAAHYAPATPVTLNATSVPPGALVLAFGSTLPEGTGRARVVHNLSQSGNLVEAAAHLYSALRLLDSYGGNAIFVAEIPHFGLGEAINDRLKRAAIGSMVGD